MLTLTNPKEKLKVWGCKNPVNATEVKAAVHKLSGEREEKTIVVLAYCCSAD